jgi:putative nucleotidyltransferase with HDIG domain
MMIELSRQREGLAIDVIRELRAHGHKAYLVGGCVRDRLLGILPKDFDVVTDARPETVLRYYPNSQTVGAHFGVVLITRGEGIQVEVATFRSEDTYSDGRRPDQVHFESDPALDAQRRDFTINGLMQDPVSGEVLDFVGGRHDLDGRIVRAIGDPEMRFREDHLRMLRAVRFAARLGFAIAPETAAAIRKLASSIGDVSAERVRDELIRILTEGGARLGLEALDQCKLLEHILPEVKAFQGVQQPPEFHPEGDVWTHVLIMLDAMRMPTVTLAAGVLFHDVGKPPTFRIADRIRFDGHAEAGAVMTAEILRRLRFSNEFVDRIVALVADHMKFKDVRHMRTSTLKRFLCLPHFEEHLELHRLDCLASNGHTETYEFVIERLAEMGDAELRPPPLITGRDLIQAGFRPGPAFGRALEAVETAQLEGEIHTPEQALALACEVLSNAAA